jgi:hypothetical protein
LELLNAKASGSAAWCPWAIRPKIARSEAALIDLGVTDRNDPITELIAKAIVNVTAAGERDPKQVMDRALNALGVRRPAA